MPNAVAAVDAPLSTDALQAALREADPAALVIPPWLLQKFIAHDRGPAAAVFATPRVQAHVVARDRLLHLIQRDELPFDGQVPDVPAVILLARPENEVLANTPGPELLLRYWRLLFYARVRAAVIARLAAEKNPRAAVQARVERLGRHVFNEARYVLYRERYLPAWADDAETYAELAALYLEFSHFDPEPLPWFFPSAEDPPTVLGVLADDVDAETVLKSTRPPGAAEPLSQGPVPSVTVGTAKPKRVPRDLAHREGLLAKAADADKVGNDVRAAIFRMRVYRASGSPGPGRDNLAAVYADALKDLDQLANRLKAALELDDSLARQWRAWLVALLDNAAGGWWNAEGRLLYDLQKVCVYNEREIYSVNVMDYLLEWRRRPLRRPQPGQRLVLTLKSLRSALRRTARTRISTHGRSELQRLLRSAIAAVEERLRDFLCPGVRAALEEAGLHPHNAVETVAHQKLTAELLDEVIDTGYLTFGAVRDAVSRNQMKLNDLARKEDFTRGDQLLRIDRKLEDNLDYVYRRGEVYLRAFHRLSSLFFATTVGRYVTKFLILPLGGAYVIVEALDHSVGLLIHKLLDRQHVVVAAATSARDVFGPTRADMKPPEHEKIFNQWWLLLLLTVFLFGVVNSAPFRRAVATFFRHLFAALGKIFIDAPKWLITRPAVQAVLKSQFARLFGRYVFKPLAFAAFVYVLLPDTVGDKKKTFTLAGVFLVVNVLLNSRAGRALEQAVLHSLRTTFARFTWDVLAAFLRLIMSLFQGILEAIDRLLYAVDEMLRFRAGQSRATVAVKAVLGVFWFYIAYVTRFAINLLVEPQINPIKHFPVVTVSHKMLFPTIPYLAGIFQTVRIERTAAYTYATGIIWCIPGIFGFLAWEFKENWKLYNANRSKNLKPVRVGSHGESVAQFLRPGFHSGTLPKIFHKLRKAQIRHTATPASTHKRLEAAHHVEHALHDFVNREFLALLNRHSLFNDAPIALGRITLATTLIRVELLIPSSTDPLILSFEQRAHWIIAAVDAAGFLDDLTPDQSRLFAAALAGLYKLAGADLVQEHVRSLFPPDTRFDFRKNDLVVWPTADFTVEATYDLTADTTIVPAFTTGPREIRLPTLRPDQLLFRRVQLPRDAWIRLWDCSPEQLATPPVTVLPNGRDRAGFPPVGDDTLSRAIPQPTV
jgi:hypothetical protein